MLLSICLAWVCIAIILLYRDRAVFVEEAALAGVELRMVDIFVAFLICLLWPVIEPYEFYARHFK